MSTSPKLYRSINRPSLKMHDRFLWTWLMTNSTFPYTQSLLVCRPTNLPRLQLRYKLSRNQIGTHQSSLGIELCWAYAATGQCWLQTILQVHPTVSGACRIVWSRETQRESWGSNRSSRAVTPYLTRRHPSNERERMWIREFNRYLAEIFTCGLVQVVYSLTT